MFVLQIFYTCVSSAYLLFSLINKQRHVDEALGLNLSSEYRICHLQENDVH